MNRSIRAIVSAAIVFVTPLAFACDYPPRPNDLPNGATASKEKMLQGVKAINAYQAKMSEYLSCMEADRALAILNTADLDEAAKKRRSEMFDEKYNAAVDEQTLVVEEFNAQIRAYKEKSK